MIGYRLDDVVGGRNIGSEFHLEAMHMGAGRHVSGEAEGPAGAIQAAEEFGGGLGKPLGGQVDAVLGEYPSGVLSVISILFSLCSDCRPQAPAVLWPAVHHLISAHAQSRLGDAARPIELSPNLPTHSD